MRDVLGSAWIFRWLVLRAPAMYIWARRCVGAGCLQRYWLKPCLSHGARSRSCEPCRLRSEMSRSFGVEPAQPLARAGAAADSRRDGERSESDAGSWLEHQDQDSEAEERRLRETYESLLGLAKAGVVGADLPEEELAKGMVHVGLGPRGRGELRAFADFLRRACRGLTPSFDSFLRSVASGAEADAPEWHARGRRGSEVNTPEWSTHGRGDGSWRGREACGRGLVPIVATRRSAWIWSVSKRAGTKLRDWRCRAF